MTDDFTWRGLAGYVAAAYLWFVVLIIAFSSYHQRIEHTGDNPSYVAESEVIRGAAAPSRAARHFVGLPLLSAVLVSATGMDEYSAIALISIVASFAAVLLAGKLWGTWAAAWFAVVNLDWLQRSLLGGAEPLFALLIFAALAAARRERWLLAAAAGAAATIVRPLGVFVLLAFGIVLLARRNVRALAGAVAISLAIGALYLAVVDARFGGAFGNFRWYSSMGLGHDRTFIPLATLPLSLRDGLITWKNFAKTLAWTLFTIAAVVAAWRRPAVRERMRAYPAEWLFGGLYLASFFCFPAWWIEGEYPRYLVPVIPMLLVALRPWLPEDRRLFWVIGLLSVTLAAVEDLPWLRGR